MARAEDAMSMKREDEMVMSLRLHKELHERLRVMAREQGRSLSAQIRWMLIQAYREQVIARDEPGQGEGRR